MGKSVSRTVYISLEAEVEVSGTWQNAEPDVGIMSPFLEDTSVDGFLIEDPKPEKNCRALPNQVQQRYAEHLKAFPKVQSFMISRKELQELIQPIPTWLEEYLLVRYTDEIHEALAEEE